MENEGRNPVARVELKVHRLEEVPKEIQLIYGDIKLSSSDKTGYERSIRDLILKNNSSVDTSSIEFKTLIDIFSYQLRNNNGLLIADDYNFSIDHFNNCRLITGYIASTKLPALFKEGLRNFYATSIIKRGSEKNAGDEMNWLNWIPSGGTVIISNNNNRPMVKGVIYTLKSELPDLIAEVYPDFIKFSPEARERALGFITRMNPYIHVTSISEQSMEGKKEMITKVSYQAEKGQPILIPMLKFISE